MQLSKIVFVDSLGGRTPACINRQTGLMLIDRKWWNNLPTEHRFFILLHEWSHAELNTTNEFKADDLAFKTYVKFGYSITQAIYALTKVLSYETKEHTERTLQLIETAKKYDKESSNSWHRKFYKY